MPLNLFNWILSTRSMVLILFLSFIRVRRKKKRFYQSPPRPVVEREAKQESLLYNVGVSNVWLRGTSSPALFASHRIFKTKTLHKNPNTDVTRIHASAQTAMPKRSKRCNVNQIHIWNEKQASVGCGFAMHLPRQQTEFSLHQLPQIGRVGLVLVCHRQSHTSNTHTSNQLHGHCKRVRHSSLPPPPPSSVCERKKSKSKIMIFYSFVLI